MYHVKLQIRINNNIYDAMKNLGRVKKWEQKECYERALKQFLASNNFVYHPVLKAYVLDVPNVKAVTKTIKLLKENDNGNSQSKKRSPRKQQRQQQRQQHSGESTTTKKPRTKETYILEE